MPEETSIIDMDEAVAGINVRIESMAQRVDGSLEKYQDMFSEMDTQIARMKAATDSQKLRRSK